MGRIAEEIRAKPLTYYWLAARLERWCIHRTAGVVAISAYTKERIATVARRTWVVPNAVQEAFFDVQHNETERATLLCVAHVNPWKNQIGLIEALEPLRQKRQFTLLFVGAADGRDAYSGKFLDMVAKREWCGHAGQLPRNQLLKELARCKAVILPSFEDNCPMVVLEAAAAAVPVAASSVGGIPDLISEGNTGRLFDPHDPCSIQKAVLKILDDKLGTLTIVQRAKEICRARHSPRVVAAQHLRIYHEIIELAQR
jgi:glycosyltransferase involved in cell wall biosynthesis